MFLRSRRSKTPAFGKVATRAAFSTTGRASLSSFHLRQIKMSATMASANLRATGAAPRVAARSNARPASPPCSAPPGPNAEQKLGDAMVAAAGKFGAKHQMEVRAALSEDAPPRAPRVPQEGAPRGACPADRARDHAAATAVFLQQPTRYPRRDTRVARVFPFSRATDALTADVPVPPVSPIVQQAAAVMPAAAANAADDQGVASSRMSYSRFLVRLRPSTTVVSDDTLAVLQARRDSPRRRARARFCPERIEVHSRAFFSSRSKTTSVDFRFPGGSLLPFHFFQTRL